MKVTVTKRNELTAAEVAGILREHLKLPPEAKVKFLVETRYFEPPEVGDRGHYEMTKAVVEHEVVEDACQTIS